MRIFMIKSLINFVYSVFMRLSYQSDMYNKERAQELMRLAFNRGLSVEVEDIFFNNCMVDENAADIQHLSEYIKFEAVLETSNKKSYWTDWSKILDDLEVLLITN